MKFTIALAFLFVPIMLKAQVNLVPMPAEVIMGKGNFTITKNLSISYNNAVAQKAAVLLKQKIFSASKINITPIKGNASKNTILFENLPNDKTENYTLSITEKSIVAKGSEKGLFYAYQTLCQLMEGTNIKSNTISVPQLSIKDYPRFAYRGMHLDVGRHFFSVDFVKRYIDYLAYHKYNTFHWHLTDDQGWRIEIKKYPRLTEIGSCRVQTLVGRYGSNQYDGTKYCGFYTQEQVKEIVKYAADRYITVIPEIEMPGHGMAALASYPELGCTGGPYKVFETWGVIDDVFCAGNEKTFNFLEDVLSEVTGLFPSKYIHIGGDECPKERWKYCPKCQQRMKENGLKDEHELQSYFIQRMEKYLNKKGRRIIGWDEILEGGLAADATVMSWRGEEGGIAAAKQNHDVIMTPGGWCYLDHSQTRNEDSVTIGGYTPLETVYNYEPVPKELNATEAKHVLGAQGNVWTEYMSNPKKVEYMIFPRMSALSEVLWTPKEKRNWPDFERRIPALLDRYDNWGANYSKAYYDMEASIMPTNNFDGIIWKLEKKKGKEQKIEVWYPNYNGQKTIVKVYDSLGNYIGEKSLVTENTKEYTQGATKSISVNIKKSGRAVAKLFEGKPKPDFEIVYDENKPLSIISQQFSFNLATGKKITLADLPSEKYKGFGAVTLVDGIQNNKRLGRNTEFLGFEGNDLSAVIDLGSLLRVNNIVLHGFYQTDSWIHLPSEVNFLISADGKEFKAIDNKLVSFTDNPNFIYNAQVGETVRYIKVVAKNKGTIPSPFPGAGNKAWLFVDEIEVL